MGWEEASRNNGNSTGSIMGRGRSVGGNDGHNWWAEIMGRNDGIGRNDAQKQLVKSIN